MVFMPYHAGAQETMSIEEQLIVAADKGDSTQLQMLIRRGANVNATTYEGVTPLMFAALNNHIAIVKILLKNGAKNDIRTIDGKTALILSIEAGNIEVAELLIRNGADPDISDNKKVSPLMHAVMVDSFYLPDMLLYYGAEADHRDESGRDALMLAAESGSFEIAIELLEAGVNINGTDINGNTPLHYATSTGQVGVMELLIINGASLEIKNAAGYTPLSVAVTLNKYTEARLLIGYGADVNTRIRPSMNPLSIAVHNRNDSLKTLLLNHDAEMIRRPDFNKISVGSKVTFNKDDSQVGLNAGFSDSRFHLMPSLAVGFRPKAIRVLEASDQSTYYQYWERRQFISLSLDKAFLNQVFRSNFRTSAFAGVSEVLTFGTYKGSGKNPDVRLLTNPRIGCIFEYRPFRLKLSYELMNLHLTYYNIGWFGISLEILVNRRRGDIRIP
jgi:ankyrin repeat protein